jgi:hypothetical protein
VTRAELVDERGAVTGARRGAVVAVVERVVGAVVVGVVASVTLVVACVVLEAAAVCEVLVWPAKEWAATADRTPVRARPPAIVPRVTREMRRRPASRRVMGSEGCGLMVPMIGCRAPLCVRIS